MTYCLGWKTDTEVYLIADAALTSGEPVSSQRSSFGELHVDSPNLKIEEAALKVVRLGDAAVTFAGVAETGYEFARNVYARIKAGESPAEAFRSAAISIPDVNNPRMTVKAGHYSELAIAQN